MIARFIILFLFASSIAQANSLDSLVRSAEAKSPEEVRDLVEEITDRLSYADSIDFLRSKEMVEVMLKGKRLLDEYQAEIDYSTAKWLARNGLEPEAIELLNTLLESLEEQGNNPVLTSRILRRLAMIHYDHGSLDRALDYTLLSLEVAKESGDSVQIATQYNMVGENYRTQKEYEQAIIYYDLGLILCQEMADTMLRVRILNNKGIALAQLGKHNEAYDVLNEGFNLADQLNHRFSKAILLTNLGFNENKRGRYQIAIDYYMRSLELKKEMGNEASIAYTLNDVGECFHFLGEHKKAIAYSRRALKMAKNAGALYYVKDISKTIATSYASAGMMDSAYTFQLRFQHLNDSIFNADNFREIARIEKTSELREQKFQNDMLRMENDVANVELSRQRWIIAFISVICIALIIIGIIFWQVSKTRQRLMTRLAKQNKELNETNVKLSSLLNEQESLFNIVAHDIRNPLSNTKKLLEFEEQEADSEQKQKLRSMIRQSVDGALGFISEFNLLHRFEKNDRIPPSEEIDLIALINEVILQFDLDIRAKSMQVQFNDKQAVKINSVQTYLKHILLNLISNAIKYSSENGIIFITVTQSDATRISIEDQGQGIDPEDFDRIFERFYRAPHALKDPNSNGLGLPLVKLLTEKLGGHVKVKSTLGEGSEFIVYLP